MSQAITVRVAATSANLGPGFDTIGLALDLYNTFRFAPTAYGLKIDVVGEGAGFIPRNTSNVVYRAVRRLYHEIERPIPGLQIEIENQVPVASGLGSSSTALLGGLIGANTLAGSPLSMKRLLALANEIEGHPDNVAPAVYGGLTVSVMDGDRLVVECVELPEMQVVIVLPEFNLLTIEARAVLPVNISRADAIFNIGRSALLVRALATGRFDLLRVAMQDRLHQPYRFGLVPGMESAYQRALAAGAAGVALSGAGPSLIAFATRGHQEIADAMQQAFAAAGLGSRRWILPIAMGGVQLSHGRD